MNQLGLFEAGAAADDFADPERIELDDECWVEYAPQWLASHQEIYTTLAESIAWHTDRRMMYERMVDVPRLVAGIPDDGPCPERIAKAREILEQRYARTFTSTRLAWYRDGHDSVAMHGDRIGRWGQATTVCIVSLGARRKFVLRHTSRSPRSYSFEFGGGDLLVMGGLCQRDWRHGIPKQQGARPRMSIQFRERDVPRPVVPGEPGP